MKYLFGGIFSLITFTISLSAQSKFSNCSAIFLNQKMVVDDYSPNGRCVLKPNASGQLTVCTTVFENNQWRAVENIYFNIIIRDGSTKTLLAYSNVTYKSIGIQDVLSKCRKGDYILISVIKDEYALPHNEILVE